MKKEIDSIFERNKRVETDKSWETSKIRRGIIALITYIIVVYFLVLINASNPYLNALVPTAGFILSTLTMPLIKKYWVKNIYKK